MKRLFYLILVLVFGWILTSCKTMENKMAAGNKEVWVINTFTMNEGENPELVANLQLELVEKVKKHWAGFVSQQTLISNDNKKVTTIEVWSNFETLEKIAKSEALIGYREKIQQYAKMSPIVYRVVGSAKVEK